MRILLLACLLMLGAPPAWAQRVQTGIAGDSIRVGDPFRAVVRIELPPGSDIVLPDSLASTADVENAGTVRLRRDSANGVLTVSAAYPLTAWRPGTLDLPVLTADVRSGAGTRRITIDLPQVAVVSVLPADTTNIEARPAKDVMGGNRVWWPWFVAALLLLAALIALYIWWRRRRARAAADAPMPLIMPRERALEELERIRKLGLLEQGDFRRFYTLLSEVARKYLQTVEPALSTWLTTEELVARTADRAELKPAHAVLRHADLVKFARSVPDREAAARDLDRTIEWVNGFPAPIVAPADVEKVA